MAKQLRIVGTGRPGIPEALEDASEELLIARRDKRRDMKTANDKIKKSEWSVVHVMQQNDIKIHTVKDPDTDETLEFELEMVPKIRIRKTGEVGDGESGEEVLPEHSGSNGKGDGSIPAGLIAQAEKAQADANVAETADGDVAVPDKAAPKKPRKGRKAKN